MKFKIEDLIKNQCYINGEWRDANSGKTIDVNNPATQEVFAQIPMMLEDETNEAIQAAHEAWLSWRNTSATERADLLKKWYQLIEENKEAIAEIMTREQGKPLAESLGEMTYANSFIEWFAEEARRTYGDTIPAPSTDKRIWVIKQSIGVCALVTPWNFPAAMITRKAGPALAAGCTIVIKPATQTPLTALALVALAEKAGFPKGVVNIVTGKASAIGNCLTQNELVKKISFTGSTPIGSQLIGLSADNVMNVSMELGGNAPLIVFEDAHIDAAVEAIIAGKSRNTGQTCISPNRIYIHDTIYDEVSQKVADKFEQLVVGNGLDEGVNQGPVIDENGVLKVEEHIDDAVKKGAKIIAGGKRHELGGTFFEPTVLAEVPQDALCLHDETFGPLAPLVRFKTDKEVIKAANNTPYGLAAYFFTNNINRVHAVSEALEAGMVGINTTAISTTVAPFGGYKKSGIGREGSHQGIEEYLETKYVCLGNMENDLY